MGYVSFSSKALQSEPQRLFKLNKLDKRASVMKNMLCCCCSNNTAGPVVSFFAHYLQAVISVAANIFLLGCCLTTYQDSFRGYLIIAITKDCDDCISCTMGSSVANQNQTKKIAETGTSQCSYIVMKGAKIFHGHY